MNNKQTVKTQDGSELQNGEVVWYVNSGKVFGEKLQIGRHDKLYKIFKSKTMAQQEADKFKK